MSAQSPKSTASEILEVYVYLHIRTVWFEWLTWSTKIIRRQKSTIGTKLPVYNEHRFKSERRNKSNCKRKGEKIRRKQNGKKVRQCAPNKHKRPIGRFILMGHSGLSGKRDGMRTIDGKTSKLRGHSLKIHKGGVFNL